MASKRRIRRKSCEGKRRFTNSTEALNAVHSVIRNGRKRGGWLNVYKCQFCKGYHFGHAPAQRS